MEQDIREILRYVEILRQGEKIDKDIKENNKKIDILSEEDKMSLYSHQFFDYWLTDHKMADISFMVCQFPWLKSEGKTDLD